MLNNFYDLSCPKWCLIRISLRSHSPWTVTGTLTRTEPIKFRATHSYSDVSSFWAAEIYNELLDSTLTRSSQGIECPWRDHVMVGWGSPAAWQFNMILPPALITVSTGSRVMIGEPKGQKHIVFLSFCGVIVTFLSIVYSNVILKKESWLVYKIL